MEDLAGFELPATSALIRYEEGVRGSDLRPVITEHTVVRKVNLDRLEANVREAAEQCNMVCKPEVLQACSLDGLLQGWDERRRLIYCDEDAPAGSPVKTLRSVPPGPLAVLIGPEGGFSPAEQQRLHNQQYVVPISLGPRVMRADTAAVAALAMVQAILGDWDNHQPD